MLEAMALSDYVIYKYRDMSEFQSSCKIFRRQADAIAARNVGAGEKVFSCEVDSNGRRKYICGDVESFWNSYKECHHYQKNFYEVITQDSPTKLFLDLEFKKEFNESKDGVKMTKKLISILDDVINARFGIKEPSKQVQILESSNDQKYSVHIIYNSTIFMNIKECGKFVKYVANSLTDDQESLFKVKGSDGKSKLFIDATIYNSNRNLRLWLSSKFGERRPLICANETYGHGYDGEEPKCPKQIFVESLVTNGHLDDDKYLVFSPPKLDDESDKPTAKVNLPESVTSSPYVEIDGMVSELAKPGIVSKIVILQEDVIKYEVSGNKFCRTKGGLHKQNKIYFKYFNRSKMIIQDCYDVDCSKSTPMKEKVVKKID